MSSLTLAIADETTGTGTPPAAQRPFWGWGGCQAICKWVTDAAGNGSWHNYGCIQNYYIFWTYVGGQNGCKGGATCSCN